MEILLSRANRQASLSAVGRGVAPPPEGFTLFGRTVIVVLLLTIIFAGTACLMMLV